MILTSNHMYNRVKSVSKILNGLDWNGILQIGYLFVYEAWVQMIINKTEWYKFFERRRAQQQ